MLEVIREQEEGVLFLNRVIEKHLQSPLLLVGEEGVGRRYSVQQAARAMFCLGSRAPNCSCVDCTQLQQGSTRTLRSYRPSMTVILGSTASERLSRMPGHTQRWRHFVFS